MTSKNSENSPLHIAEVQLEQGAGSLGLTLCPGKKDVSRSWNRDLVKDLQVIRAWGATIVVTLIEDHEFRMLSIESLADEVRALGMNWLHMPIVDVNIPDRRFEDAWVTEGPMLHDRLDAGEKILIHCRGGLGRAGLVAGRILVERGCSPEKAIAQIRSVRPHAIQTSEQEQYVHKSKLIHTRVTRWKDAIGNQLASEKSALVVDGLSK